VLAQRVGQFGWQASGRVDLMKPQVKMGCSPYLVVMSSYCFCSSLVRPNAEVQTLKLIAAKQSSN
jgi:hypothetical protein